MALSARIFGVNSWSILVPAGARGRRRRSRVLYATVRRWFGPAAALLAGAVLALTPVAALMFRFNNPDALLVLLLVARRLRAWCGRSRPAAPRWLVLAGALVGFGFLTKMLQAFLVLPAFGLVYLRGRPDRARAAGRVSSLAARLALVVSAGWWVAIVALWPAATRPYIGGSQNNSVLEPDRSATTASAASPATRPAASAAGAPAAGSVGRDRLAPRMFSCEFGGQIVVAASRPRSSCSAPACG